MKWCENCRYQAFYPKLVVGFLKSNIQNNKCIIKISAYLFHRWKSYFLYIFFLFKSKRNVKFVHVLHVYIQYVNSNRSYTKSAAVYLAPHLSPYRNVPFSFYINIFRVCTSNFSSPELKVLVSFSYHYLSGVRLSVWTNRQPSHIHFYFRLLFKNHLVITFAQNILL